jgi:cytochrome o ubiquinol oxidase operon protein cyoD
MKSYLLGFIISVLLTVGAYFAVAPKTVPSFALMFIVIGCSLLQIAIQFVYFLHLGREPSLEETQTSTFGPHPRWNVHFFLFTVLIALVIVIGSLWIMYNLNYRM